MRKLSRKKPNREHMIKNLAASLVLYETIDTTEAKAKEVKSYLEKVIARNKENGLSEKRAVLRAFFSKDVAAKLTNELIPRYQDRSSGFVKSYRLKNRLGDNAEMIRLELIDKKVFVEEKPAKEAVVAESKTVVKTKKVISKKTEEKEKKGSAVK